MTKKNKLLGKNFKARLLATKSRIRKRKNKGNDLQIQVLMILGLVGSSISIPITLSYFLGDKTGGFFSSTLFSVISLSIIFWSFTQTFKNAKIKGAEELENKMLGMLSASKLDMAATNKVQDREIRDLRETVKDIDGLAATLDVRLQELNKSYTISIVLIKVIDYLEYLDKTNEDLTNIIEELVLKRSIAKRAKPPKIDSQELKI